MSERWVPLLAAVVGLLVGMGGALVGGWVANEGQERRFENEEQVRTQNLRLSAYADFLQAAADVQQAAQAQTLEDLDAAEAKAELFASSEVRKAARGIVDAVAAPGESGAAYGVARDRFLDAAKAQLPVGE